MVNEFLKKVTRVLRSTKDAFIQNTLCRRETEYIDPYSDSLEEKVTLRFCAVGECLHTIGYTCEQMKDCGSIATFTRLSEDETEFQYYEAKQKLTEKYGIDFVTRYKEPIACILCEVQDEYAIKIKNFEMLVQHCNDAHAQSFTEVANNLDKFAKVYDLETGEKLK